MDIDFQVTSITNAGNDRVTVICAAVAQSSPLMTDPAGNASLSFTITKADAEAQGYFPGDLYTASVNPS